MKMLNKIVALVVVLCLASSLSACSQPDQNYGTSNDENQTQEETQTQVELPQIKSDDEVMPTFFDISLFDEENYSDIYLGKDFEYKITYGGTELSVPTSYKAMSKKGWNLLADGEYTADSQVFAGKSLRVQFVNEYNNLITAVFYNKKDSSVELKKCPIVKLIVEENCLVAAGSQYGQFFVNGISNGSAITDVIEHLGAPSHFYAVNEKEYYLDYFLSEDDKRNSITVYVDVEGDYIQKIEISKY